MSKHVLGAAIVLGAAAPSVAQSPAPTAATESASCCIIPALYPIRFEFRERINSELNKIGDRFTIRLATPIEVDSRTVVPAGTPGYGEVIHADKSRFGGRPGELILAVRYLDSNGTHIPLRSLTYAVPGRGKDNQGIATAAAVLGGVTGGVISMFITGKEVNVPAGTIAYAKVSAATLLPPPSLSATSTPSEEGNLNP